VGASSQAGGEGAGRRGPGCDRAPPAAGGDCPGSPLLTQEPARPGHRPGSCGRSRVWQGRAGRLGIRWWHRRTSTGWLC